MLDDNRKNCTWGTCKLTTFLIFCTSKSSKIKTYLVKIIENMPLTHSK